MRRRSAAISLLFAGSIVGACAPAAPGTMLGIQSPAPTARASRPIASVPTPTSTPLPTGVIASIPLEVAGYGRFGPAGAVIGFGSVWVETHRGTWLFRIDPATNEITATIPVGQEACGVPAVGAGRIWLGPCDDSTKTILVDPNTNQISESLVALGGTEGFTADAAWIASNDGKLLRVDPKTYRVASTYDPFPGGFVGVIVADGRDVWLANENYDGFWQGDIARFDPTAGVVTSDVRIPDPGRYAFMVAGYGYLWIKGAGNGPLYRVTPTDGTVKAINLGDTPGLSQLFGMDPATGLDSIWVRYTDGSVIRVDAKSGKLLASYPADPDGGGGDPVVGFDSLWVVNFASDTLWRDRIEP